MDDGLNSLSKPVKQHFHLFRMQASRLNRHRDQINVPRMIVSLHPWRESSRRGSRLSVVSVTSPRFKFWDLHLHIFELAKLDMLARKLVHKVCLVRNRLMILCTVG